jgi:hypothetical protein
MSPQANGTHREALYFLDVRGALETAPWFESSGDALRSIHGTQGKRQKPGNTNTKPISKLPSHWLRCSQ